MINLFTKIRYRNLIFLDKIFNKETISFNDYDKQFKFISFMIIFITFKFKYNYYLYCNAEFCCA